MLAEVAEVRVKSARLQIVKMRAVVVMVKCRQSPEVL
jgi:hypothetical protein